MPHFLRGRDNAKSAIASALSLPSIVSAPSSTKTLHCLARLSFRFSPQQFKSPVQTFHMPFGLLKMGIKSRFSSSGL